MKHFCPHCGVEHGEEELPEEPAPPEVAETALVEENTDVAETAIEAVAEVATTALETVADVVAEHEETDRTGEVADVFEALAEEHSEEVIAEEAGGTDEPELVDETPEEEELPPEEPEEAQAVEVPPQVAEPETPRRRGAVKASKFRARRAR